jgi:hypothetical protein
LQEVKPSSPFTSATVIYLPKFPDLLGDVVHSITSDEVIIIGVPAAECFPFLTDFIVGIRSLIPTILVTIVAYDVKLSIDVHVLGGQLFLNLPTFHPI